MSNIILTNDQHTLVPTKDYPHAYFKYEKFNPVQSRVLEFYDQDVNALIASATSSGKTTIAEIMLSYAIRIKKKKGLYLVPMRALAQEKIDEWTDKKHHFNDIKIAICTGDYRITPARAKELAEADLIIMTTEMLSARTRHYKSEKNDWLKEIGCLISDESHLLTVPGRGDHLEVGLMKLTSINDDVKFVFLSATLPNVEEVGEWMATLNGKKTYVLRSSYRPCNLNIHYETYFDGFRKYDDKENEKVSKALDIIDYYPDDKFLVFAHTKRTGELMKSQLKAAGIKAEFHNANLEKDDRISLENRFRKEKEPRVIVATPTLAWGCYAGGTTVLMTNGLKKVEDIVVGDSVLAKSNKGFVSCKILKVGPTTPRYTLEFTTQTGEVVQVSQNHQFYSATHRNSPSYESAEYISVGDYLAVPGPINLYGSGKSDDEGYFVGYVMGDGSKTDVGEFVMGSNVGERKIVMDIAFGASEAFHIPVLQKIAKDLSGFDMNGPRADVNGVLHLTTKRHEIVKLVPNFSSGRNKDKLTLHGLKRNDASFVRGILQGLFDSDGGFSSHGNGHVSIEFTSISKQLVSDVQQYLLLFGVRSAVGCKRMKNSVINGRLQKAKREWIHRVRIYSEQIPAFLKNVGFRNEMKRQYGEYLLKEYKFPKEKNIIPVRHLLHSHAKANNVSPNEMMKSVNCDLWNAINKQDLKKETCDKILELYPIHSPLTDLIQSNVRFVKVKSKKVLPSVPMFDIEVEGLNNYVGGGIVSHNCNLPARRVIILGIHRGLDEVETYNITQMVGRSGRVGLDPQGDAYILLPESEENRQKSRLKTPQNITSQLLTKMGEQYKVLAFHLVSEIHHGDIQTMDEVHKWFKRSLASYQSQQFDDKVVDKTIELLMNCGAIKQENGIWKTTTVGQVSSMFYYSPFDVSDLKKNFADMFQNNRQDDDYYLSMALGNTDLQRLNIVSKAEKEEMSMYVTKLRSMDLKFWNEASAKAGYCYYQLLNGNNANVLAGIQRNFQFDYNRLSQVLIALDSIGCKWGKVNWLKGIEQRIAHGVPMHLVNLCAIPNVGKVRAKKLYEAGIKTPTDFANLTVESAKKIMGNVKVDLVKDMLAEATKLAVKDLI